MEGREECGGMSGKNYLFAVKSTEMHPTTSAADCSTKWQGVLLAKLNGGVLSQGATLQKA